MNTIIKALGIICLFLITNQTIAQVFDEWDARPNVSLKYKFNKRLSVSGTYYLYLEENFRQYNKSVLATEIEYKFAPWLKAGIDYRFGIDQKDNYHDIRYSATFSYKASSKWKFSYRPMLQQEFISLKKEHLQADPIEYYLRNRVTVSFKISNNWEVYAFTENYLRAGSGDLRFYRQKTATGAEVEATERSKFGARFEVIHKKNGKVVARPNISYTLTLGYRKASAGN
ncbi:MAG: DUF2490 domain-containing protein [Bacteroidetes bacterium]|nr:DUF2490 domain-containing protein [Bacteroidota bacterium]